MRKLTHVVMRIAVAMSLCAFSRETTSLGLSPSLSSTGYISGRKRAIRDLETRLIDLSSMAPARYARRKIGPRRDGSLV